jgi:hypothetical protein
MESTHAWWNKQFKYLKPLASPTLQYPLLNRQSEMTDMGTVMLKGKTELSKNLTTLHISL